MIQRHRPGPRARVGQLPQRPQPVDHRVVGPEDRVESGQRDLAHRPPDPDVHLIVQILQLHGEIIEVLQCQHRGDLPGARQPGRSLIRADRAGLAERTLGPRHVLVIELGRGDPRDRRAGQRVLRAAGQLSRRVRSRDPGLGRPVPPRQADQLPGRHLVQQVLLEVIQVRPVPGQKQRAAVRTGNRQRQPVDTRPVLKSPVVRQPHHPAQRATQRGQLDRRQPGDTLAVPPDRQAGLAHTPGSGSSAADLGHARHNTPA